MKELDALYNQIVVDEARLRQKKRRLLELATKFNRKKSISQMFPTESAVATFTIDSRLDDNPPPP